MDEATKQVDDPYTDWPTYLANANDLCSLTDEQIMEHLRDLSDLPSSLIVTNISPLVFSSENIKDCFENMFKVFDTSASFDYFRSFKRCRINFSSPNSATLAKLSCHDMQFHGSAIKCFFAQISDNDLDQLEDQHLKLPPLEKQFLISPPASPPADWEQCREKEPIVAAQKFELFSRLAALAVNNESSKPSEVEVFPGDANFPNYPKIVVHTCGDANEGEESDELPHWNPPVRLPRTPRPEFAEQYKAEHNKS